MVTARGGGESRGRVARVGGSRGLERGARALRRGSNIGDVDREKGKSDVALPGHDPSNSHASVSYNLPDTVLELFRTNEHLLGTRVLRPHTPVACNRQMKLPFYRWDI
jgi:hypothetical protein